MRAIRLHPVACFLSQSELSSVSDTGSANGRNDGLVELFNRLFELSVSDGCSRRSMIFRAHSLV